MSDKQQLVKTTIARVLFAFAFPLCSITFNLLLFTHPSNANSLAGRLTATSVNLAQAKGESPTTTPATDPPAALEPKAMAILKAMGDRLAAARTLTFTSIATYESPSRLGPPLAYTTTSQVTLQRPDKLQVITPGDGSASEFYYNGKTMVAYAPVKNLVAIADAPPTIDAALKMAYQLAAIYFPFTDVVVANPYKDMVDGLRLAFYIGESKVIDQTTTDMVAIANDRVFAQIWIGTTDKLPRMIRAVYKDDPLRLRHQVAFSNWQLDGTISADAFASSRANSATRIPFKSPDPLLPANAPPPGNTQPRK
uniref:Periplasmic protein-like protein n=1 Tax=Cyanothece sp. (strain PCC 7425 / ATCC 29141) TaxID=395961 RepID=B8HV50_CYAP4